MKLHTILIVDDQVINRKILHKLLEKDYQLLEAENGQQAVEILRSQMNVISAVLLDIIMPVMNGYEVLAAMQKDPQLSKIPVIVSSKMEGDEAEEKALSLGAQDFIAKPYKANIIRHRLNNTIRLRETAAMMNRVEKDELTGLLSKQFFLEQVANYLHQHSDQKFDLVAVGVERFKLINDTYGVGTGDKLLCHMASVFKESPESILSTRFTADHFYMLSPRREHYSNEVFETYLKKIHRFPIDMDIKINCGIYMIEDDSIDVIGMCDRALLAANINKGHFQVLYSFYDESMRENLMTEQFIRNNMQIALEERQFHVYYQPKYDMTNEMIAGAEALVRWIHPTKGFMSPGEFIPLFEHNGFITQLDEYVWESACRDIRSWLDKGYPPIAVSVNVSRADVYNPKLTDILLGLVAKYQIPIRCLHLEITESACTNNPKQIIQVVDNLRNLGFVIEMDDFGSGYSSLNMLAEMPVDVLKLDMGFVQHETGNPSGKGILSFVISLAKWLNLAVVAEGVETREQISTLRSMDCNYVQGFYYAKPMKLEDFENLLKTSQVTEMICKSQTASQFTAEKSQKTPSVETSDQVMLIVDDIELNRDVLASTFMDSFRIVEKENGKEALEYLKENYEQVAVVLLDLLMPVMDGFQLLEKIRADKDLEKLPVIITSQGDADSEERALAMKADDFISKPYNPEIIQHRVRSVIEVRALHKLQEDHNQALMKVEELKPFFDIVRLVNPETTLVCEENCTGCDLNSCYSVWGKATRCNNCISICALHDKKRYCKLEYSEHGLYFVISQYVPYKMTGAVIEMVTKLDDQYVDNVFDRHLLYTKMDALNRELNKDSLTNVFNRRYIDENLDKFIRNARISKKDLGIAMIDVDNFKKLNDSFGHQAGDQALCVVAGMLHNNIAQSKGDFVARYGGDEFLIVCRDIPMEVFVRRLTAVARLVQYMVLEDGTKISISISAGTVNLSEMPNADTKALIQEADQRLYLAKKSSTIQVKGSQE